MITENQAEQISEIFARRYQQVYDKFLNKVGTHMKELGTLSPTDIHRLEQLAKMNKSMDEIRRDLERVSELNSEEMNRIFREVSEEQYKNFAKFYLAKGLVQDEIQKQTALKKQLNAIGKITEEAFANLSNTTVMSELYQECIDKGILAAQQGLTDYKSAVRDIIRETAIQGNKVHYESGHRRRRDTAARMNVLDGMRDINMEIARQTGEEFGADGVELSAHMCCAPDHLDYQGKQFSLEEFDRLQETLERRIGVWHCHHTTFPIILGISKPTYSNSDLQKMRDYSTEKITIGKYTKTRYQWTQVQRKLETKVREQKDIANIAKASGNDILRREAQAKINKYTGIYENVSKAAGIPTKKERMTVSGFRPVKAKTSKNNSDKLLTAQNRNDIIKEKPKSSRNTKIKVNNEISVQRTIEKQGSALWSEEKRIKLRQHEKILSGNKHETAIVYDKNGDMVFKKKGDSSSVSFTKKELKQMNGCIVTHNHPNNSCFSCADINTLREANISELRVATNNGAYVLRNGDKWDIKYNSLDKITERYYEIDTEISKSYMDIAAQEGKSILDYDDVIQEQTVTKLCKEIGISFSKEK